MKPSVYDRDDLAKGEVLENRDQVTVTFGGGNVFHVQVDDVDEHEVVRGADNAWQRAEALRKELNPGYETPLPATEETPLTSRTAVAAEKKPAKKGKAGAKPVKSADAKAGEGVAPAKPREIVFGDVKGTMAMLPVDTVYDFLHVHAGRVAALQGGAEARRLARRVRATDGRCAPVFLTKNDVSDDDEVPALFDGLNTLACAINLDMKQIAVVILPSRDAQRAQGTIVEMMRSSLAPESFDDGEDLRIRAQST